MNSIELSHDPLLTLTMLQNKNFNMLKKYLAF